MLYYLYQVPSLYPIVTLSVLHGPHCRCITKYRSELKIAVGSLGSNFLLYNTFCHVILRSTKVVSVLFCHLYKSLCYTCLFLPRCISLDRAVLLLTSFYLIQEHPLFEMNQDLCIKPLSLNGH